MKNLKSRTVIFLMIAIFAWACLTTVCNMASGQRNMRLGDHEQIVLMRECIKDANLTMTVAGMFDKPMRAAIALGYFQYRTGMITGESE